MNRPDLGFTKKKHPISAEISYISGLVGAALPLSLEKSLPPWESPGEGNGIMVDPIPKKRPTCVWAFHVIFT